MFQGEESEDGDEDEVQDIEQELGVDGHFDGDEVIKNVQGDPTDGDETGRPCVERWKANADDSKKGMFSCFEESGLFVAVCRHGALIRCCDMVSSGEL